MTDTQDPRRAQYEQARRAFEDLQLEDRALFIIQETIGTVVHGIEKAGQALSREIESLFRDMERKAEAASEPEPATSEPGPAPAASAPASPRRTKKTPPPAPDLDIDDTL